MLKASINFFVGRSKSLIPILFLAIFSNAQADDSLSETAKELANDSKRATENAVRVTKDKTCEMVKGKMECAIQKVKHGIQKAAAEAEDIMD